MINMFLLALAEGFECISVILQLPSIIFGNIAQFFYTVSGVYNNDNNPTD